jgi:hypothetical protein
MRKENNESSVIMDFEQYCTIENIDGSEKEFWEKVNKKANLEVVALTEQFFNKINEAKEKIRKTAVNLRMERRLTRDYYRQAETTYNIKLDKLYKKLIKEIEAGGFL